MPNRQRYRCRPSLRSSRKTRPRRGGAPPFPDDLPPELDLIIKGHLVRNENPWEIQRLNARLAALNKNTARQLIEAPRTDAEGLAIQCVRSAQPWEDFLRRLSAMRESRNGLVERTAEFLLYLVGQPFHL